MTSFRFSLKNLIALVGVVAICYAILDITAGSILSAFVFLIVINPHPFRWRTFEFAVTSAWLLGVIVIASEVSDNAIGFGCFFLPIGLSLAFSWLLRQASEAENPQYQRTWTELVFTPASCVLAFALWKTDLDFRLRLAVSEPALRAEARQLPRGFRKSYSPTRGAAGLFKVYEIEERDGCVLWDTGCNTVLISQGLAYVPFVKPPHWHRYRFQHVHGPWWIFTEKFD